MSEGKSGEQNLLRVHARLSMFERKSGQLQVQRDVGVAINPHNNSAHMHPFIGLRQMVKQGANW